jgi:hypothetical protein
MRARLRDGASQKRPMSLGEQAYPVFAGLLSIRNVPLLPVPVIGRLFTPPTATTP